MVALLRGTETLREAQIGALGGKIRKRRRRGGQDVEYTEKEFIEVVFTNA